MFVSGKIIYAEDSLLLFTLTYYMRSGIRREIYHSLVKGHGWRDCRRPDRCILPADYNFLHCEFMTSSTSTLLRKHTRNIIINNSIEGGDWPRERASWTDEHPYGN